MREFSVYHLRRAHRYVMDPLAQGALDECTRECLAIGVGGHCRGKDVVRVLDELTAIRGAPATLPSDNGPEFGSAAMRTWCEGGGTGTLSIDPRST